MLENNGAKLNGQGALQSFCICPNCRTIFRHSPEMQYSYDTKRQIGGEAG
ncbi:MAG: hypothetical protein WC900_07125 [Oscillospiraceae bacterium]|jgi:hypothetical protein